MTGSGGETLSNLLHEERRFPPPPELADAANATAADYARADADAWPSGPRRPAGWSGRGPSTRCSTGAVPRSPAGSPAGA